MSEEREEKRLRSVEKNVRRMCIGTEKRADISNGLVNKPELRVNKRGMCGNIVEMYMAAVTYKSVRVISPSLINKLD